MVPSKRDRWSPASGTSGPQETGQMVPKKVGQMVPEKVGQKVPRWRVLKS